MQASACIGRRADVLPLIVVSLLQFNLKQISNFFCFTSPKCASGHSNNNNNNNNNNKIILWRFIHSGMNNDNNNNI